MHPLALVQESANHILHARSSGVGQRVWVFTRAEEQNPMHRSLIQRAVIVALGSFVAWSAATNAQAQQIQTVFVISMENHNLTQPVPLSDPQQIKGNVAAPYLNSLMTPNNANALQTSFATNYQNVGPGIHPSAPNYIWSGALAAQGHISAGAKIDRMTPRERRDAAE